jgi:hypothetical protein
MAAGVPNRHPHDSLAVAADRWLPTSDRDGQERPRRLRGPRCARSQEFPRPHFHVGARSRALRGPAECRCRGRPATSALVTARRGVPRWAVGLFARGQTRRRVHGVLAAGGGRSVRRAPGIPEESLPRLFEPFYRVPGISVAGTGIGLATVHRIVQAHGGTIRAESVKGEGTRFEIRLPLAH